MTTRKYFAGQALSCLAKSLSPTTHEIHKIHDIKAAADLAREYADALIISLKEKPLKDEEEEIKREKEILAIQSLQGSLNPKEDSKGDSLILKKS